MRSIRTQPLRGSQFEEYFEQAEVSKSRIQVATPDEAKNLWSSFVHPRARTFFHLPDEHWLVSAPFKAIGRTALRTDSPDYHPSSSVMRNATRWVANQEVVFFATNLQALLCDWATFLETWPSFLVAYDDCSFLMSLDSAHPQVLLFTARGEIRLLERPGSIPTDPTS